MLFNNYRPISLLSVFSKIIERLMYNRLIEFLNKNNFFNKYQFGFRNNHSTVMALIVLFENLTEALDKGDCAIGIFLDFQKAFDTVDHNILLDKLYVYGIRGIAHEWFINYLSNRTQSVNYHECVSDSKTLKCGVPQGSILGPLLFLIYINDLPSVSTLFMPILFADDTSLFCTGQNPDDLVQKINIEMEKIYSWVKANKVSLNVDKTNFMLFTPKHFSRSMGNIYINGTCIMEVTETKFLGVVIDYKLNWSSHIMHINKKIAKGIGIILKARKVFNNETLISLYYTIVYPYLNYCIHVWGKAYNTHLKNLLVLQNKVLRIVTGVPPRTSVHQIYIEQNILPVKRLYNYNVALFMYKHSNDMLPSLFDYFFCKVSVIHDHNSRKSSSQHLYVWFWSENKIRFVATKATGFQQRSLPVANAVSDANVGHQERWRWSSLLEKPLCARAAFVFVSQYSIKFPSIWNRQAGQYGAWTCHYYWGFIPEPSEALSQRAVRRCVSYELVFLWGCSLLANKGWLDATKTTSISRPCPVRNGPVWCCSASDWQ